ncbi:MAG: outer membrane protein assembly factor BamE, partial [Gammaproteobacteria bacterium]
MKSHIIFSTIAIATLYACAQTDLPRPADLPHLGNLPFIHKIDIQQGNVITQEMIGQLEPGMDKKKVNFIMGSPIILDTFHSNRWDYLYTFQEGGGRVVRRRVTLYFDNDKLARVDGDIKPAAGRLLVDTRQDTTVEVPGEYNT